MSKKKAKNDKSPASYRLTPIDPLISRDARPFGEGGRVRSLDWLSQSVTAGAIRTALWKEDPARTPEQLKQVSLRGPFPLVDGKMYLPRPLDIAVSKEGGDAPEVWQIRPIKMPKGCGTNMPFDGLLPAAPDADKDFKPERLDAFWSADLMTRWLTKGKKGFTLDEGETLATPPKDDRTHVKINPDTGSAEEGMLFSTTGLDFTRWDGASFQSGEAALEVDFGDIGASLGNFIAPVGGERRLARFYVNSDDANLWTAKNIKLKSKLRMVLATPAVFENGWLPGWLEYIEENNDKSLAGQVPGTSLRVKLVSAVTGRWQPLSGWSYDDKTLGPKTLRRAVPAGSAYFFELLEGDVKLEEIWLRSVCDDEQDRRDGLGLALWGAW